MFGKYPAILLDFKCNTQIDLYDDADGKVFSIVHKAYKQHPYLSSSKKLSKSQKQIFNRWWNDKEYKKIPRTQDEIEDGLENLCIEK